MEFHEEEEEFVMIRNSNPSFNFLRALFVLALTLGGHAPSYAQQILGTITGTVHDASGAAVPDVTATARNIATNLTVTARSQSSGKWLGGRLFFQ